MGFIAQIILIILAIYLIPIKSYYSKKNENIATKQDISGITKEIEQVKQDYRDRNASLISQLELLNQHKFSIETEKRNEVLNCHSSILELISNNQYRNISDYEKDRNKINDLIISADYHLKKASLYFLENDFEQIVNSLILNIQEWDKITKKYSKDWNNEELGGFDDQIFENWAGEKSAFYVSNIYPKESELRNFIREVVGQPINQKLSNTASD